MAFLIGSDLQSFHMAREDFAQIKGARRRAIKGEGLGGRRKIPLRRTAFTRYFLWHVDCFFSTAEREDAERILHRLRRAGGPI